MARLGETARGVRCLAAECPAQVRIVALIPSGTMTEIVVPADCPASCGGGCPPGGGGGNGG